MIRKIQIIRKMCPKDLGRLSTWLMRNIDKHDDDDKHDEENVEDNDDENAETNADEDDEHNDENDDEK